MTEAILPPNRLRDCALALAGLDDSGPGEATSVDRQAVEPLLASALIGPAACDEYLGALAAAFGSRVAPPGALVTEFPVEAILRDGLGGLSDEQLARLGRSESAVRDLNRRVDEALASGTAGSYWLEAELLPDESIPREYRAAAERAVEGVRRLDREARSDRSVVAGPGSMSGARHRRWVKLALPLALAASLLLAFLLGTIWPGHDRRREVRLASIAVRGNVTRGIEDVALDVTNGSDRRLFVTVIGLVPGRKTPAYHYRQEGRYIDVPPDGTAVVKNLPPEFEGSTVLVIVSTGVPAGGVVRDVTSSAVTPDTAEQGAGQILKAMSELGIDTDIRVVALPSKKR
jgi:hypothetical protein